MESAWDGKSLGKLAVNSLIGLWCLDDARSYKCRSSRHDADAPAGAIKHIFQYADGERIFDFVTSESLVSNTSCRPLHDLALCTEAVRVGQLLYVLRQARALPFEFKTDSCPSALVSAPASPSATSASATSPPFELATSPRQGCGASTSER